MIPPPKHTLLRYFDCWGRAQSIRDFLNDQGIAFDEVREQMPSLVDGF